MLGSILLRVIMLSAVNTECYHVDFFQSAVMLSIIMLMVIMLSDDNT
jgi:hypothetical protein